MERNQRRSHHKYFGISKNEYGQIPFTAFYDRLIAYTQAQTLAEKISYLNAQLDDSPDLDFNISMQLEPFEEALEKLRNTDI